MPASRRGSAGRASACARRACGRSTSRAGRGRSRSSRAPARAPTASGRASRRGSWCRSRRPSCRSSASLTLLIEPCGLWHDEHAILPSRTGMCATARSVLATCSRWQVAHSCGLGRLHELLLGRLRAVHAVAGGARRDCARSCALPSQPACVAAVVAGQAGLADLRRLHLAELPDVPLGVVVDVRLPGPVAALAAVRRRRRARVLRLRRASCP